MIINAYTLYDVKSLTFSPPFFAVTHGVAVRMLQELVGDLNTSVGRHPADYTLYCVGSFDDQSGELLQLTPRHHIKDAIALVPIGPVSDLFERERHGSPAVQHGSGNGAVEVPRKAE